MAIKKLGKALLSDFPLLDGLFRRFIWSRVHFPEVEMRFLSALPAGSIDVAVDVGAAMGSYSWILNRVSRQVYAFEPGNVHNRYISRVVFGTKINVVQAAVGSVCGFVNLYTPGLDSNALHSATLSRSNPVANLCDSRIDQVEQVTLDSFLPVKLAVGRTVDVLKVDVEGYELEVFKGAVALLSKHHPLVICEIEARHNANYSAVFGLLKDLGYDCYIFQSGAFELFSGEDIREIQLEDDLKIRIGTNFNPDSNRYINNFVFQHPQSRIKVKK